MVDPELFGQQMAGLVREIIDPLRREVADLRQQLAQRQDVSAEIAAQVKAAVEAIPVPRDGKDFDPDLLRAEVAAQVAAKMAEIPTPKDGKSVDPSEVLRFVKEAVDALPKPADGKSITLDDVRPILAEAVKQIEAEARASIESAIKAIPAPVNGKDADMAAVKAMVDEAVAAIPRPADGKSVTVDDVRPVIAEAVREAVKSLPPPEPGKSVTVDDVAPLIRDAVAKAVAELPQPVHVAGAMIDREGSLLLTMSNGEIKSLGRVVGKDGADGLSFEDFDLAYIEETHEISIKAKCAGVVKELRYDAGGIRPAGYWRDGVKAKACECWSCDGSLWIAKRPTSAKPAPQSDDWVLAARKGRDGESVVREVRSGPADPVKLTGKK